MRHHRWWHGAACMAVWLLCGLYSMPVVAQEDLAALKSAFKRPNSIPFPASNPYTPEKAALGKMLFFDPRLSRDQNLNCASCHNPSFGWEAPLPKAIGAAGVPLKRQSPTVLNRAWANHFFWDGRANSIEAQARGPIESKAEMDMPLAAVVRRLQAIKGYQAAFQLAFPGDGITETTVLKAIATYERTLVSGMAPFDRWIQGDEKAIPDSAKNGFKVFTGKGRCSACHSGWNLTDDAFHDVGMPTDDLGRFDITKNPADRYAVKTPTLRELTQRAPYMHNGSLASVEAVIDHYVSGGVARPTRSPLVGPLPLTRAECQDLLAFLKTLTSENRPLAMPVLPPPQ